MASIIKADTLQSTTANVFVLNSSGTEYARFDSSGVFQLANPTTFPAGTVSLPSITATGDTNTGLYFPAADTVGVSTGGSERMRIDAAGIAKFRSTGSAYDSTPGDGISDGLYLQVDSTGVAHIDGYAGGGSTILSFGTNAGGGAVAERMRIDSSGNLLFNSGYGSVATAYGCRAWVNFNGAGTVAINASGNVTSITDNGTGNYTVNFTTAMPDVNYAVVCGGSSPTSNTSVDTWVNGYVFTTTSVQIEVEGSVSTAVDRTHVSVVIFR